MSIFVSYARADHEIVRVLEQDLRGTRAQIWIDRELEGGQAWWEVILGQIRSCELFVFALSPSSLNSRACMAELSYALALGRPLMPVMVEHVSIQLAPRPIADAHVIDYTVRTPESAVSLVTAVMGRQQPPPPLPDPLPQPPPTPMSYLNPFRERIRASELSYQQQAQLVIELRQHLDDQDARATTRELLTALRRRPDIVEVVGRDIDALLAAAPEPESVRAPTGTTDAAPREATDWEAGWYPDPTARFTHRYWDGSEWTAHVSSAAGTSQDPLVRADPEPAREAFRPPEVANAGAGAATGTAGWAATTPSAQGPKPAFDVGTYVLLIVATVFIPLVGLIVGPINLKHAARNGQAKVLLWVGMGMFVLYLLLVGGG